MAQREGRNRSACATVDQSSPKPAQNAPPSPRSSTTRTSWSASASSTAAASSSRSFACDGVHLVGPAQHQVPHSAVVLDPDRVPPGGLLLE